MSLVQTLVSRENDGSNRRGSDISSVHAMDVEGEPQSRELCPKMPMLDGSRMSKGRRSKIEAWVDYLEAFIPCVALFDDQIPGEVQKYIGKDSVILNSTLPKNESIRSTRTFLYLRQSFQNYPRGLDILKQVEREQLGVSAGYKALRRLRQDLSVCSRIEASTLREEVLRYTPPKSAKERPLDAFGNVQVELAKYARLVANFPDLFLSEADQSMIVLKCLDVDVKRYILLRAKMDSMSELERAIKFYDANIKILNFAEKPTKERANPLLFDRGGKAKGKDDSGKGIWKDWKGKGKGKEKGKDKGREKGQPKGKGDDKGQGKDRNDGTGKGKGGDTGAVDQTDKKDKKYDRIKCYYCGEMGHFANKCPKPKKEKANATLLEPQLAGSMLQDILRTTQVHWT